MSKLQISVSQDTLVSRAPDILMAEVDGETVLMSVERGSYFGLADTAKDIWARLETATRAGDLCRALALAYDGEPERIEAETLSFLARMAEAGMIKAG